MGRPRHDVPIEVATIWDVLDWDVVCHRARGAVGDPKDNPLAFLALTLVNAGAKSDEEASAAFRDIARRYLVGSTPQARIARVGELADMFGADPIRLKQFVRTRWALLGGG